MREDVFTPEMVEYVARQVNDGIREWAEGQRRASGDRHQIEDDLRAALAERDIIREAIRRDCQATSRGRCSRTSRPG